ncbi:MAG: DUF4019 domain-containing protein [Candidatus Methylacidiphilales bacterium]|nr:DUF4019 domain-containing protein [Candidatus Methylacidiphilales bacterium]
MHALISLCYSARRALALVLLAAAVCSPALCTSAQAQSAHADGSLDEVRAQNPLLMCYNWLIALDSGNPAATYNWASSGFRKNVSTDDWSKVVQTLRKSRGATLSRTPRKCEFPPKVDGLPAGEYFVVYYITSFEKSKFCLERVTAVKEKDVWRVCDWGIIKN